MKNENQGKKIAVSVALLTFIGFLSASAFFYIVTRSPAPTQSRPTPTVEASPAATGFPDVSHSPGPINYPTPIPSKGTPETSPTSTPVPYEDKRIAEARKQFGEGKIAFKPPEEMIVGKTETLEARITHQEQTASLEKELKGRGKTVVKTLKVSCRMRVTLTSEKDDFNITPVPPSDIRLLDPKEWF